MPKVRLKKIESNHNNLRTNVIEGVTSFEPVVGSSFTMFAEPLEGGNLRIISTTPVVTLERNGNEYLFKTANSTYGLIVLEDG